MKRLVRTSRTLLPSLLAAGSLLGGCSESDDVTGPRDVTSEVSEDVSTVVKVHWTTAEDSVGYVAYGPTPDLEFNTPLETKKTRSHTQTLLGLRADSVYHYRVVTWDGGDGAASDVATFRTGDLPVGMPVLTKKGEGHDQFTLVPFIGQKAIVSIVDSEGEIVWYHTEDRDLEFFRVRLALDGKSVLYNAAAISGNPSEASELVRVSFDGSKSTSIPVPLLAHDFVELPDGTLTAMVVEYRDFEGEPLRGDKLVEIDPDGNQTTVWSAWDCFDPATDRGDDPTQGWTFANALDYDAEADAYYLSLRLFSSIIKIDRKTGSCEWVLGSGASTFEFAAGSGRFLHQHQFQVFDNHLLVMDNEGSPGTESRVLEYELDFEAKVAKEVWSYTANPSVKTVVLGEPVRLPNGDTFVNWSAAGQMERVTKSGKSIWQLNTGAGFIFGFHTMAESLYPPDTRKR